MAFYKSKFTGEEIDQRLTQGTYDDAVNAGFKGTKEEFDQLIWAFGKEQQELLKTAQQQRADKLETESKNIVEAINEVYHKADNSQVLEELSKKQNIQDDNLQTSNKTIVGAINQIKESVDSISDPYEINLTNLLSAEDSESISTAIGGIDNLNATVQDNRIIVGTISNGSVSVSIRILGNVTTLYYLLDSVVGLTLNEVAITNTSGTLSKSITTHSVLTENMVINSLESDETTLPLSAAQGKVLATDKQDKTDNNLNTTDKTIPGSINEILNLVNTNNRVIMFNADNVDYQELRTAVKGGKLIYIKNDDDYYVVTNYDKDISNTITLHSVSVSKGINNSLVTCTFTITNTESTLTKFKEAYTLRETNDFFGKSDIIISNVLPDFIKQNIRNILTLGNGLGWGNNNIINVTLDTDVFFVAAEKPESPTDNQKKKICLVPAETSEEGNYYTEYIWVVNDDNPNGYWEEFGTYKSEVDLTPYLKIEDAQNTYATKTELSSHTGNTENPHSVTKSQVGLGNVDNTSDINKPVSTAQQAAIDAVDNKTAVYTTVPELAADYTIPANATTREYIYEISIGATTYNVTAAEGIKWIDNNLPLVEANSKLVVSVVNNIAVWGTIYE